MNHDFGMAQGVEREATTILGKPSEVCFFCHSIDQSVDLKEWLNGILRRYNKERNITTLKVTEVWWKTMQFVYESLHLFQNAKWTPDIPRYILVEKQQWISLYFMIALGCDMPIIESLLTQWPAFRIAKRDIHDHLCHHKAYVVQQELRYVAPIVLTNIVPWDSMVEIMF